jgi:hypothetical protein
MRKAIASIAAVAILSAASLITAQAGGASSAPSKYNNANNTASVSPPRNAKIHAVSYPITEFSSSSARLSAPKR